MVAGGAGGAQKVDEFQPHPIREQLPGIDFCISSSPTWRILSPSPLSVLLCVYLQFKF